VVGSRAPGPRVVWSLRTVFVSLKRHLASCAMANYLLLLGFQGYFVIFCEIPRKCVNSAAEGKFCGSARNFAARGKLWALLTFILDKQPGDFCEKIALEKLSTDQRKDKLLI
jgi:hypothetical protein